jgi:hypothetical protein
VLALAKLRLPCRCTIKYIVPQLHFTQVSKYAVGAQKFAQQIEIASAPNSLERRRIAGMSIPRSGIFAMLEV